MFFKFFCFISDIGILSLFYYMISNFWEFVLLFIILGVVLLGFLVLRFYFDVCMNRFD